MAWLPKHCTILHHIHRLIDLFHPFSLASCDNLPFCSVVSLLKLIRSLAYAQRACCTPPKFNSSPLRDRAPKGNTYSSRHHFSGAMLPFPEN